MKQKVAAMKSRYQDFQKNMKALKQANITFSQMANIMKASDVWWKLTVNLKEIEGSWPAAFKTYLKMFQGVPRKNIRQTDDHPPDDTSLDSSSR
jgi:hypothetical protein